jgi:head-tail adaptor
MRNGHCSTPVALKRATSTRDDFGHHVQTWSDEINPLWVAIKTRASSSNQADGLAQIDTITITTPWYPAWDILATDRIEWNSSTYEVLTIAERDGRGKFLDIIAAKVTL